MTCAAHEDAMPMHAHPPIQAVRDPLAGCPRLAGAALPAARLQQISRADSPKALVAHGPGAAGRGGGPGLPPRSASIAAASFAR